MTPDSAFEVFGQFTMLGWLLLIVAIIAKRPFLRDIVVGRFWPSMLSIAYLVTFIIGWASTPPGGYSSLSQVRALFSVDWLLLAGWTHYLAFDLFVGAYIAADVSARGLSRLYLIPILPLVFLFGPVGFLFFQIIILLNRHETSHG